MEATSLRTGGGDLAQVLCEELNMKYKTKAELGRKGDE